MTVNSVTTSAWNFHIEKQVARRHMIDILPDAVIGEGCHRFHEHLPRHAADHLDNAGAIETKADRVTQS